MRSSKEHTPRWFFIRGSTFRRSPHGLLDSRPGEHTKEDAVHFVIRGEITRDMSASLRQSLFAAPTEPLRLFVESRGGCVASALACAEAIRAHRGPTIATGIREVGSAALLPYSAATIRRARPTCKFVAHLTETDAAPRGRLTAPKFHAEAARLEEIDSRCRAFIAAATGIDIDELHDLDAQDETITATKALALGLVTDLIGFAGLSEAARGRRERKARQQRARSPVDSLPIPLHLQRRAQAFIRPGRPLGITHAAL